MADPAVSYQVLPTSGAEPLNRKERRRLAAGTKKVPAPCPCCSAKDAEAAVKRQV
jgi:hypothetical protein